MIRWLRRALRTIEDVIWPRRVFCLACEELADDDRLCCVCRDQLASMRMLNQHGAVRFAYIYGAAARNLVLALKFDGVTEAADILAEAMAEEARAMALPADTIVTWVSMPMRRKRSRGIDHGYVLAQAVAERIGLPVQQLLTKDEGTRTQLGLTAAQRRRNLLGRMHCPAQVHHPVLLVDDVVTTGSTVAVCTEVLLAAGAPAVYAIGATRVPDQKMIL